MDYELNTSVVSKWIVNRQFLIILLWCSLGQIKDYFKTCQRPPVFSAIATQNFAFVCYCLHLVKKTILFPPTLLVYSLNALQFIYMSLNSCVCDIGAFILGLCFNISSSTKTLFGSEVKLYLILKILTIASS